MAPEIVRFNDMAFVSEDFDATTSEFICTTFGLIESDDTFYSGQVAKRKLKIPLAEYSAALVRIPDVEIYPELPQGSELTQASGDLTSNLYLKRPRLDNYEEYKTQDCVKVILALILEEAHALEAVSKHPHPNIVRYHGCRVRRGFITGLVLDRHVSDLRDYVEERTGPLDKKAFVKALESAISHLHSLGLAHNDINHRNILVSATGWIDENDTHDTSEFRHDLFAIEKIRVWLDEQIVDS